MSKSIIAPPVSPQYNSRMKLRAAAAVMAGLLISAVPAVHGCDLCGCYTPQLETFPQDPATFDHPSARSSPAFSSRFYAAIAEQFTHFGTLESAAECRRG